MTTKSRKWILPVSFINHLEMQKMATQGPQIRTRLPVLCKLSLPSKMCKLQSRGTAGIGRMEHVVIKTIKGCLLRLWNHCSPSPGDIWQYLEAFLVTAWRVVLASAGSRPVMLLNNAGTTSPQQRTIWSKTLILLRLGKNPAVPLQP